MPAARPQPILPMSSGGSRDVTNAHDIDGDSRLFRGRLPQRDTAASGARLRGERSGAPQLDADPGGDPRRAAARSSRRVTAGQTVWTEWEHRGTRPDTRRT